MLSRCKVVVFDAYGTLLDLVSAMSQHREQIGTDKFEKFNEDWRAKQLSYSWLRSMLGPEQWINFQDIIEQALEWAMQKHHVADAAALKPVLMKCYTDGKAYPEALEVVGKLHDAGLVTAILSNGERHMLETAADHTGLGQVLDCILCVEDLACPVYKPHPSVYQLVIDKLSPLVHEKGEASGDNGPGQPFQAGGCASAPPQATLLPKDVCFVSGNGWDVHGAATFGFQAVWVNRDGAPIDRLPGSLAAVIPDLTKLPDLLRKL